MRTEFDFIRDIKERHSLGAVGDDCAVLPLGGATDLLVTADMLVEDIDFRLEWSTPEQIGWKALAVSLSDIAAMGGDPRWATVSIAISDNLWKTDFLDRVYDGWQDLARRYACELVGGDLSRTDGKLTIDCSVIGEVGKGDAILRSGAKAGDAIYVTGPLGGSAYGLRLLQQGLGNDRTEESSVSAIGRHLEPQPRLDVARLLQNGRLATAMIDMSDGLSSDLGHLTDASGVGAEIDLSRLPKFPGATEQDALNGGEDFELLFTVDQGLTGDAHLAGCFRIGTITPAPGVFIVVDGRRERLKAEGYRHF